MKLKRLKDPLVLFLILTLAVGTLAAGVSAQDGFGSDSDSQNSDSEITSSDFGSDADDSSDGTTSDTSTRSTATGSDNDDVGSSRDGFGEDTDDAGFGNPSDSDSTGSNVSSGDFGSDTDDSGSASDGYGGDADDAGSGRDGAGDDTDDSGGIRNGFGDDTDDQGPTSHEGSGSTSMGVTMSPQTVAPGDKVEVTGTVGGIEDDVIVELNSEQVATATPDSNGDFSASFRPQETGTHTVTVTSGGITRSFTLEVISDVEITSVTWPESVEAGSTFQVCADVVSSSTPQVTLYVDGQSVQTMNQQGVNCFQTSMQPGDHQLRIEATANGKSDQRSATVNAYSPGTGNPGGANGGNDGVNNGGTPDAQGPLGQFISSVSANAVLIIIVILVAIAAAVGVRRFD